jgi:hypothetical protein
MDRIGIKDLEAKVDYLNRLTDSPLEPYTRDGDRFRSNPDHYQIGQAYGGVELQRIFNEGGAVSTPLNTGHIPKRQLAEILSAFINGIESEQQR